MAVKQWNVGDVLASADLNVWTVPLIGYKSADQSRTSNTTLVNDTQLVVPMAANALYEMWCFLYYEGGTQGGADIKWTFTSPAGASGVYTHTGTTPSGSGGYGTGSTLANVPVAGTNGASNTVGIDMHGTIDTAGTSGNLQLQWAQNTSSATALIVHAGSALKLVRIG